MQRKDRTPALLVPSCRVFFEELLKSDFILQENGSTFLVTPTGAWCKKLFGVGEVQEVERRGKIARLKLHDTTAALAIYANRDMIGEEDRTGERKRCFIAFRGHVHVVREGEGKRKRVILLADDLGTVEEHARNGWILTTAQRTMERIEALRISLLRRKGTSSSSVDFQAFQEHYALDADRLDAFASMAIDAVTRVWLQYHTRAKELIVALLKKAGTSGVAREQLVATLKAKGLEEAWIAEVIEELVVEELCYEPKRGVLKLFTSSKNPLPT
jgi:hypothetical protein